MYGRIGRQKMLAEIYMECGSIFGKGNTTMTDKQIIIDGVDVSGCTIYADGKCTNSNIIQSNCKNVSVCYYKEYKRKEQEYETLEEIAKKHLAETFEMQREIDQLKAEIETLKQYKASKQASYESMQREWNNAVNENRELKAENENWQKEYWKLEQGNDFLAETNSRLKQTLTEIKEIAEDESYIGFWDEQISKILQKISECEVQNENN